MQSNLCVIQHRANALKSDRILQSLTPEEMLVGISEPQLKSLIEFAKKDETRILTRHEAKRRLLIVKNWLCQMPISGGEIADFQVLWSINGERVYKFLKNRFRLESDSQRL